MHAGEKLAGGNSHSIIPLGGEGRGYLLCRFASRKCQPGTDQVNNYASREKVGRGGNSHLVIPTGGKGRGYIIDHKNTFRGRKVEGITKVAD